MLVIEAAFLAYFSYVVGYTLFLSAAGRLRAPLRFVQDARKSRIAILIPAYKEDAVIYSVAKAALQQSYPQSSFEVIVIADSLQERTIEQLKSLPIKVVEVSFSKSTKVKALNAALQQFTEDAFDVGLILDADNLMEPDFLEKVNAAYQAGYRSIQGQRVAKNKNTRFALLDALSEAINNHIYRRGTFAVGWSSSLIGSGMAFDLQLLRQTLAGMKSVGGFDREMEVLLLEQGVSSCYLENAKVYDEKVEKAEVFQNQRKRWIASQFKYLKKYFRKGLKALFKGKWTYANSALLRNIQLPRVINLGMLFFICLLTSLFNNYLELNPFVWWSLFGLNALAFLLAVPKEFYTKKLLWALLSLPKAFGIMFLLLFKLRNADKTFIHTPHSSSETPVS
ncbi:glycosyltransferase [Nafulsella turpanensis]|uniref:glycosyltransferase n=1 Tax=Nafulsella turpanensis TaxID=1265690 RepID=UPI000349D1E6|nr:glycosyltransferase [Nafulsella turpanensis]